MVALYSGLNWEGKPCSVYLDDNLYRNLEAVKKVVNSKDFDFVAICSGLPGAGKSTFSMNIAKFLDPKFNINNICFSADEFVEKTSKAEKHSAIILDESFASLNTKVGMSPEYLRIINHLQLIRQRNLFIILNLPNFFDLNKSIAIYRSSFLFVVYGQEFGDRGSFAAFGREEKKLLYIYGKKELNYTATKPNFRGRFIKQKAINAEEYEKRKLIHLRSQGKNENLYAKERTSRDRLVCWVYKNNKILPKEIANICGITDQTIYNILKKNGIAVKDNK